MHESMSAQTQKTTALHLQSSHWLTDLLLGMGDGILLPAMWFLASWQISLAAQQKTALALGLVLLQSILHGIGLYVTSVKRDESQYNTLTDKSNRNDQPTETSDVKSFLAKLDIPESIQVQAWLDTEAEKKRWNAQLNELEMGAEKPNRRAAGQSAFRVMIGYLLGGAGSILIWMMGGSALHPIAFIALLLGLISLVAVVKARYTQTSIAKLLSTQVATATLVLVFAWLLGRFLIADLFTGG